jgi:DNA topoisomerase-1
VFDEKNTFENLLKILQQGSEELCDPIERDLSTEKLLLSIISSE